MQLNSISGQAAATAVWQNATRTLTAGGANIVGSQLQTPLVTANISLTSVANTTVVNYTGNPGVLALIGFIQTVAFTSGAVTVNIVITIDAGSPITIQLMTGAMNWTAVSRAIANNVVGSG